MWLVCFQVLHAQQDRRAEQVLAAGYVQLQEWAARLPEEQRRTFLALPAHRELVEEWRRRAERLERPRPDLGLS